MSDMQTLAAPRRWRERQDGERELLGAAYNRGDYVFTFEDGRPPHPDTIRQRFDRLAAAAGLSRITCHDLRNDDRDAAEQAASFLIGAGWDPESDPESDDRQGDRQG